MDTLKKGIIVRNGVCVGAVGDKNFSTLPIGCIAPYLGRTYNIPRGYLFADGSSYKTTDYPELFNVIRYTYGGSGDTFNVPNLSDGRFLEGSIISGGYVNAGLPNITGEWGWQNNTGVVAHENTLSGAFTRSGNLKNYALANVVQSNTDNLKFDASKSNPIYGNADTVQPKSLRVLYIIKAFHTNEGVDSGVSDDVIDYVNSKISGAGQLNIKNFDSPNDTIKYITITAGFPALGGIEINSPFVGKYMFSYPKSKPIYFGDQDVYNGYLLEGWAWNANGSILYLKVSGTTPFSISVLGSLESDDDPNSVVVISDMSDTAPDGITFTSTPIRYNAVIDDNGNSSTAYTWSSSKIAEYVVENMPPVYSGSVIPIPIASGATVTTDWNISSAGDNYDSGRVLMLNSNQGTFIIQVKGALGSTSTVPTPTVISSITNSQSGSWSSAFELSVSGGKLRIKNKSGALASWRFM